MRSGNILFSAVHLLIILFILGVGVFFLGLAKVPHLRLAISALFAEKTSLFAWMGIAIILVAFSLGIGLYRMHRGCYYRLEMNACLVSVEPELIHQYVEDYLKHLFPHQKLFPEVLVHSDQKIEILIEIPQALVITDETLLQKIEKELGTLLAKCLGYRGEFFFNIRPLV